MWFWDSLVDVTIRHFPIVFGEFDGQDDAGDEEDQAPAEAEPEAVLKGDGTQQKRGRISIFWMDETGQRVGAHQRIRHL